MEVSRTLLLDAGFRGCPVVCEALGRALASRGVFMVISESRAWRSCRALDWIQRRTIAPHQENVGTFSHVHPDRTRVMLCRPRASGALATGGQFLS
jgi:hypothetical protein